MATFNSKWKYVKLALVVRVPKLRRTWPFHVVVHGFAEDGKEMYIPLANRVRSPYRKLRTEFFPFDLWPIREARGP